MVCNSTCRSRATGRPVVLLHGFPDSKRLWTRQVPALVDAGFQVIVLRPTRLRRQRQARRGRRLRDPVPGDRRDRHPRRASASNGRMSSVTTGVQRSRGRPRRSRPNASITWSRCQSGIPSSFASAGMTQREKSWYMLLFQFAGVAENWLSSDDWAGIREWSQHPDVDAVVADLERDESLTTGLNWYRAQHHPRGVRRPTDGAPTRSRLRPWACGAAATSPSPKSR